MDRNIPVLGRVQFSITVALRKESVDRNASSGVDFAEDWLSLSARRAWIEIMIHHKKKNQPGVALRKESVDRNFNVRYTTSPRPSRSPQGERG